MRYIKHGWSCVNRLFVSITFCLALCLSPLAQTQSNDESSIRSIIEKFFAAYQRGSLDGVLEVFSDKAPELGVYKQNWQKVFTGTEKFELKSVSFSKTDLGAEKALLRVRAEISTINVKTDKPVAEPGFMNLTFRLVKEGGIWRIWQYAVSEEELATRLLSAKTKEEQKALLASERELITPVLVQILNEQGIRLVSRSEYARALSLYETALEIANELGDKSGKARTLGNMGSVYNRQGNYAQALPNLQRSLNLAEELGEKRLIASALAKIGDSFYYQSNYTQSLEYYQRSLKLYEESDSQTEISEVLSSIGNVYWVQSNYPQALEQYQRALKIREALGDKKGRVSSLGNIGMIYNAQGNNEKALEYFQQSLKQAEESGEKRAIATMSKNVGGIYNDQGNYIQAMIYYQRGLKLSEEIGDKFVTARMLSSIGVSLFRQGDYVQAQRHNQQSLELMEKINDKLGIAIVLGNMGLVYREQGNYPQALECLKKSLKLSEELRDKVGIVITLRVMGSVYVKLDNYIQGLEYLEQSLKVAEEVGHKRETAFTLYSLGVAHQLQGNYVQALEALERSVVIARQINSPNILWQAYTNIGKTYRALGKTELARQAFTDAISTIEQLRSQTVGTERGQQRFLEDKVSPYYEMVDLLMTQNNPLEALNFVEQAKGRVLLDVLRNGKVNVTKAMTNAELELEQKFKNELVHLNAQLFRERQQQPNQSRLLELETQLNKVRLEYESYQTELYVAHPELKVQRGELQTLSLNQLGALLDSKTAMLEFVLGEEKSYLFVLTKEERSGKTVKPNPELKVYPLSINSKQLSLQAESFRKILAERNLDYQEPARKLYDLLLKPAERQLRGKSVLCIIPDAILWELPFQALQSQENRFLIEDYDIFYAPSLSTLNEMVKKSAALKLSRLKTVGSNREQVKKPKGESLTGERQPVLLAFGNPLLSGETISMARAAYRDEKLGPLPEAETEVKTLGQIYGVVRSKVLTGADASESSAKAEVGKYKVVHFATHGILDDNNPFYSRVILSTIDKESEDGLLEAWEIMKLDLGADLVVLSACQTALGRIGAGEGMIGMSWALFVAGSPATLVSQWKVDSASTGKLMIEFHRRLASHEGSTKAGALREAAKKLLNDRRTRHPFYWAGFVIIGNGF